MKRFFFLFGYCPPDWWVTNEQFGDDAEASMTVIIEAPDCDAAERIGLEAAEHFVNWLFERSDWVGPVPSWRESRFAYWTKPFDDPALSEFRAAQLPVMRAGETPEFAHWLGKI